MNAPARPSHSPSRRRWPCTLAAAGSAPRWAGTALAAQRVVEVDAYAHPPVQSALKPLRDRLAKQGSRVTVVDAPGGFGAQAEPGRLNLPLRLCC
jgi:hypothetical protein